MYQQRNVSSHTVIRLVGHMCEEKMRVMSIDENYKVTVKSRLRKESQNPEYVEKQDEDANFEYREKAV